MLKKMPTLIRNAAFLMTIATSGVLIAGCVIDDEASNSGYYTSGGSYTSTYQTSDSMSGYNRDYHHRHGNQGYSSTQTPPVTRSYPTPPPNNGYSSSGSPSYQTQVPNSGYSSNGAPSSGYQTMSPPPATNVTPEPAPPQTADNSGYSSSKQQALRKHKPSFEFMRDF